MPAQKRSFETTNVDEDAVDDSPLQEYSNDPEEDGGCGGGGGGGGGGVEDGDESDRSRSSSNNEERDEYVTVKLSDIRKEVQCPICLGIIRKTRTVMECLHRFCRECIDKAMRLGNNECPACRTHCASRRSLRDDVNYDALIAALYPDIDKYEEEELAFQEEEASRNKQIQASIAQTFQRQTEALGRKKATKGSGSAIIRRSQGRYRDAPSRGRRSYRTTELQGSDDNEDANDGGKDSSSADERSTEVRPKRAKRWVGPRFSQPSSAAGSTDGGGDENDAEVNREAMGASPALIAPSERLAWGKGGIRSHTRHGGVNSSNGKYARNRVSKLVDYLRNLQEKDDQLAIHLMLMSFDEQRIPSLQQPYMCCRPSMSIRHLCKHIALQTASQADEIEIHLVKEVLPTFKPLTSPDSPISLSSVMKPCQEKLQVLHQQDTLAGLATNNFKDGYLVLGYKKIC
ncbi:hypothetical protein LWI29_006089 [Acer saccharum]|uniref:RING-type domain-containing protein n=1 Tax=Acer saccharum TaxID=4024 RepID=A0AA39RQZ1_ACESA|nr:hypothetical protein LWI29_006089 [Acer saccharum]